ncbi:amino acid ABC transporter permease [Microbispora bryophytorum]|uniref:Amino acid ABC transporter permease n=1 Tax=Microbispora bryophytorum TaxID=1460882 RepID=A0A8H9H6K0_9ACTN|nr:amino acid ABC transporter permease [Microbispora bryophytorum]MBD3141182.1 amino acid ABC transporter permease [Microbispora bryophytorum]TQR99195.1 amino acid ABC transporter permease [Microbispora bryophytorum]GGO31872.1 amino acid ABC transporter permease [Microbispora bryophytorum]
MSNLLFDEPGPRARRRIRLATVAGVLVLLALLALAVRQFAANGQLAAERWQPYATWPMWRYLLGGLWSTALAAVVSAALAMAAGIALALGRVSRRRAVRLPSAAYVEAVRTVPALLLVYLVLFALPRYGLDLPLFWKLVVPLAVSNAALFAEVFRAGIMSVERGQGEAALALGLSPGQSMRLVVLPQAARRVLPSIVSQSVGLLKDTSLGFVVSYAELLYSGKVLANFNGLLIQTYIVVALVYLVVNASLSALARSLDRSAAGRGGARRRITRGRRIIRVNR